MITPEAVLCGSPGEPIREPIDTNSPELARLFQECDSRSASGFMYVRELARIPRCSFASRRSGVRFPSAPLSMRKVFNLGIHASRVCESLISVATDGYDPHPARNA
jgi:hypothetical protein